MLSRNVNDAGSLSFLPNKFQPYLKTDCIL